MKACPSCGAQNPEEATHCASCAKRLDRAASAPISRPISVLPPPPSSLSPIPVAAMPALPAVPPPVALPAEPPRPDSTQLASVEPWHPLTNLAPMPEVPEHGFFSYARYALAYLRARWHRRAAINQLGAEIKTHVASLDGVLGQLGTLARKLKLEHRAFNDEAKQIDAAEARRLAAERACADLTNRKADENAKYNQTNEELEGKVGVRTESEKMTGSDVDRLETQRRGLRERRKEIDKQIRAMQKSADDRDDQAGKAAMAESKSALKKSAEELRRDARRLEPDRDDVDRQLAQMESPYQSAVAKHDAARADLDGARRALEDAREGHRHRLAEIDAEHGHKSRELAQADAEIARRLVTLGTLVNLNRVDTPDCMPLFARIDALKGDIAVREGEIERLTAESHAYDSGSLLRGAAVLGGGLVVLITIVCIVWAVAR